MTTEAGRRLLEQAVWEAAVDGSSMGVLTAATRRKVDAAIGTVEAEARAALLAELRREVIENLTHEKVGERMQLVGRPWVVGEAIRAAGDEVLAILDRLEQP